jgi:hypothetical protein
MTEQTSRKEGNASPKIDPRVVEDTAEPTPLSSGKSGKLLLEMIASVGSLGLSKYEWSCGGGFGR